MSNGSLTTSRVDPALQESTDPQRPGHTMQPRADDPLCQCGHPVTDHEAIVGCMRFRCLCVNEHGKGDDAGGYPNDAPGWDAEPKSGSR